MSNRIKRLNDYYWALVKGTRSISSLQDAKLFLEGIRNQQDPARCTTDLITGTVDGHGLKALQSSMRYDTSAEFLNTFSCPVLTYLRSPVLESTSGNLNVVIKKIVDPPIFWDAFVNAFLNHSLENEHQINFVWLLYNLLWFQGDPYFELLKQHSLLPMFARSSIEGVQKLGLKVQHLVDTRSGASVPVPPGEPQPGGRHDNDKGDYRTISILPTSSEIMSSEKPFLRPTHSVDNIQEGRTYVHLDNQFRLLRQDMLHEMKDELKQHDPSQRKQDHRSRAMKLTGLTPEGLYYGPDKKHTKWGIAFRCSTDLPFPFFKKETDKKKRKAHLQEYPHALKHGSVISFLIDDELVSFPTLHRDEDLLTESPAIVVLQFEGQNSIVQTFSKMKFCRDISLIVTNTPLFAYEPVLKALQDIKTLPLDKELLHYVESASDLPPELSHILSSIREGYDLQSILSTTNSIKLDPSQIESLRSGITQSVSLIQGPPGTGKSFIGSLLAKLLHDNTNDRILIVCYTNHALDDVLNHLLSIGIPPDSMVRLGALRKVDPNIEALSIFKQQRTFKWTKSDWRMIDHHQQIIQSRLSELDLAFQRYASHSITDQDLLEYLEFEKPEFYAAFQLPVSNDGMLLVGRKGRAIEPTYLIRQWMSGWDAGTFHNLPPISGSAVWKISRPERLLHINEWKKNLFAEIIEEFCQKAEQYNQSIDKLALKRGEENTQFFKQRRIIACTTTAAAKYAKEIQAATPGIVLVEEAGEILESHILTALGEKATKLVLIGDHKQLRPKINDYSLSVENENGDGFNLNVSLFERLILHGYRHNTLEEQHRMRPEISALIRHLTYNSLQDAETTQNRPHLRGIRGDIVFIDHHAPEGEDDRIHDRMDASSASKQNKHEAAMIIKIVRYLAQQGYRTEELVILTPYLGQLRLLRSLLQEQQGIDPVLSDLDSFDLVRAGLLDPAAAKVGKKNLRLATIDNYQGEESDIVLVSLTRSGGKIGFMKSPERLNVLLSRARNALIMIGNVDTFEKGGKHWTELLNLLRDKNHIRCGLPVVCQQHPDRESLLICPSDFDEKCPDGGCDQPCGTMLKCGLHACPSKCHQIFDHSKMKCEASMESNCGKGHPLAWKCHVGMPSCKICEREQKREEKRKADRVAQQAKRDADRLRHAEQLAAVEDELQQVREAQQDAQVAKQREDALELKKRDLEALKAQPTQPKSSRSLFPRNSAPSVSPAPPSANKIPGPIPGQGHVPAIQPGTTKRDKKFTTPPTSEAETDWKQRKEIEGDTNDAVDTVMAMSGLEDVKHKFLEIKDKIDVAIRQGTNMTSERFNIAFLGNPGTGKTTVARLYAKFLASVQALPSDHFVETTGSRLAESGVSFARGEVEKALNAGGGAIFIDEAYQLVSDHNLQGRQVLDFLLAEMENHVGTLVFILAGYDREMERFFQHNPGIPSRVPLRMQFNDYSNDELLSMFSSLITKKFQGRMKIEDGVQGLYARVAIKRLGRGRGRPGFGNARALQNLVQNITGRQASRLAQQRRLGLQPDDLLLTKEDLIGPEPAKALADNPSWKKLQELIGLKVVKDSVKNMFGIITTNYWREVEEQEPLEVSLNRVFLGSPGTGKTTVAKLYGQILSDLSLLSSGEVVVKNPADFIGSALGQSEQNTKAILAATIGKVLVIDEAYMLYGGSGSNGTGYTQDPYKTAVIDTIVAEVQNVPGEDRCILLLGYKTQMEDMFQNVNPGLARRFAMENAFHFDDFTRSELVEVLEMKLRSQNLEVTSGAIEVALDVLERRKRRPNFGNGGEVENLIGEAKIKQQARQAHLPPQQRAQVIFAPEDFDPEFNRGENASENLKTLFEGIIGHEDIRERLIKYQNIASAAKRRRFEIGDQIPTNFVFKGPPGTGKTTVARKMGQVYYDMGFLASPEVVEKSASDLVAQYVGQTGPKTRRLMESALGRVLFIDEAYRLGEGQFAQEAIDELVALLTHPTFLRKMVVILAGYTDDMDRLLARNSGLSSRFSEQVMFSPMEPDACLELLRKRLGDQRIHCAGLENRYSGVCQKLRMLFQGLGGLENWGNARDVQTLSREVAGEALSRDTGPTTASLEVEEDVVIRCTASMLARLSAQVLHQPSTHPLSRFTNDGVQSLPPQGQASVMTSRSADMLKQLSTSSAIWRGDDDGRDAGVSDEVWQRLQRDRAMAEDADRRAQEELAEMRRRLAEEEAKQQELERQMEDMAKREREQARLKAVERSRAIAAAQAELERKRRAEEERRRKEAEVQAKLQRLGVCVAGYRWIKQSGGYRCAGGSHFVTDGELGE